MDLFSRYSTNHISQSIHHSASVLGQGTRHSGCHSVRYSDRNSGCHFDRHSGYNLGRNPMAYSKSSSGFTLIEVLIAAVILFSALAITAELYSASSLSANKASSKANFYQISPIAISAIKAEIRQISKDRRQSEFSSELSISGIHYQWQAHRIEFKPRAPDYDDFEPPHPQFGLFEVNVIAQEIFLTANSAAKSSEFQFKVATW